jgi:hypothetical protein
MRGRPLTASDAGGSMATATIAKINVRPEYVHVLLIPAEIAVNFLFSFDALPVVGQRQQPLHVGRLIWEGGKIMKQMHEKWRSPVS